MAKIDKAKQPRSKAGAGAPQLYDREAVTTAICKRLATGEPMAVICRDLGIPVKTVNDWRLADEAIRGQFEDARDLGFDAIAHGCIDIVDNTAEDPASRRVRVDTRMKLLAKWDPRRYGDKVQHADADGEKLPAPQFIIQPVRSSGADE